MTWMNGPEDVWYKWMGQRPPDINDTNELGLRQYDVFGTAVTWPIFIYKLDRNRNWAQGRLKYIVLNTVCVTSLFDIIHWAFAHAHSCVCSWAKGGPNPASVKFVWNNQGFEESALMSHAWDSSSPFCYPVLFCHVGEDFGHVCI